MVRSHKAIYRRVTKITVGSAHVYCHFLCLSMIVKQVQKSKCQQEERHIQLQIMGKGRETIQPFTQSETLQFHCDSYLDFQVSP